MEISIFLLTIFLMQGCSNTKTLSLMSIPLQFDLRIKCTYRHGVVISEPVRGDHSWFEPMLAAFQKTSIEELEQRKRDFPEVSLEIAENSSDMVWDFFDLTTDKPYLISDGDVVSITTFKVKDFFNEGGGMVVVFPQEDGAHMFVLWFNGISYWTKHNHILGSQTQTYVGQCVNL